MPPLGVVEEPNSPVDVHIRIVELVLLADVAFVRSPTHVDLHQAVVVRPTLQLGAPRPSRLVMDDGDYYEGRHAPSTRLFDDPLGVAPGLVGGDVGSEEEDSWKDEFQHQATATPSASRQVPPNTRCPSPGGHPCPTAP